MFGKYMIALLLVSNVACAKARWAPPSEAMNPQDTGTQGTCSLRFNSGLCVDWSWETAPQESDFASFKFQTYRIVDNQKILEDIPYNPLVVLWMPSMGHGSSPTKLEKIGVGTYLVSRVYFVMPGSWEIHFQSTEAKKVLDEAIAPIEIQ